MKLHYKVALTTVGAALVLSVLLSFAFGGTLEIFFVVLGTLFSIFAILAFVIGLVLHIAESRSFSQAFFITSGILLVLGVGICGPMLAGIGN